MKCQEAQKCVMQYINKELLDKQLEDFLEHIKCCQECYEELEIHYTIQFALFQLEHSKEIVADIPNALTEDLLQTSKIIYKKRHRYIYSLIIVFLAQMAVVVTVVAQLQIWHAGNIEATAIYKIRAGVYRREHDNIIQESTETEDVLESESVSMEGIRLYGSDNIETETEAEVEKEIKKETEKADTFPTKPANNNQKQETIE